MFCTACGSALPAQARFCSACGRPAPAPPLAKAGGRLQPQDYEHPSMQALNQSMRRSPVLRTITETVSKRVGRRWYESTFNSIPVTDSQYPRLHDVAAIAGKRLGLDRLPSVYVEADRAYGSSSYGSKEDAFVNLGSFLLRLLTDREMLFLVGHEYGHLLGDHALWMTVSNLMFGEQRSNIMAEGLLGFLNPVKMVTAGAEALIAKWMRVADFTADRVGLLAVGDFEIARRTLFLLYLKNRAVLGEVDIDKWMQQQAAGEPQITRVSQMLSSGAPYLGVRMNELKRFHESPQYRAARSKVEAASEVRLEAVFDREGFLSHLGRPRGFAPVGLDAPMPKPPARRGLIRGSCPACGRKLALPIEKLPNRDALDVTCPGCNATFTVPLAKILGRAGTIAPATAPAPPRPRVRVVKGVCPACRAPFAIPIDRLSAAPVVTIECKSCRKNYRLSLARVKATSA